jgi:hypothetical protein
MKAGSPTTFNDDAATKCFTLQVLDHLFLVLGGL